MVRFAGFDGLRGVLAWTVVVAHILVFTGLIERAPLFAAIPHAADGAVSIFIILSGFVIAHLLVSRSEPFSVYIRKRFFRIYPIYIVALSLGIGSTMLNFQTFLHSDQTAFVYPSLVRLARSEADLAGAGFVKHLVAHLTMLHGAISSNVLNESQYMFLSPAWSLSLEWQFYLVAPAIIWAARKPLPCMALVLVALAAFHAYTRGRFGSFILPSFLPGAGLLFAIGIATRLALERYGHRSSWVALVLLASGYVYERQAIWPVLLWGAFCYSTLWNQGAARDFVLKIFDSKIANHLGKPSYSTYLLHMPVLQTLIYLCSGLPLVAAHLAVIFGTIGITYLLSIAAYRWIELPGIEVGKRITARVDSRDWARP